MAMSLELIDYVSITTQNGTTDTLSPQPSDNCHTLVVYNTHATLSALVAVIDSATALTASNAATLPPGSSITLRIGTHTNRPCGSLDTGSRKLRVEGVGGTPVLSFQYVNSTRETTP